MLMIIANQQQCEMEDVFGRVETRKDVVQWMLAWQHVADAVNAAPTEMVKSQRGHSLTGCLSHRRGKGDASAQPFS